MKKNILIISILSLAVIPILLSCKNKTTAPGEQLAISITSPANNSVLADPVYITAAVGSGYTMRRVDFFIDGDSVASDSIAPYYYFWNIYQHSSGTNHILLAVGHTADSTYNSQIINVSLSYSHLFTKLSSVTISPADARGVAEYGGLLFLTDGDAGVMTYDIRYLGSPSFLGRYDTPGSALRADVNGFELFIADKGQGVLRLDASNGDTLISKGRYVTQTFANDVAVSGHYLFIAENDGFSIVNRSDPDTLRSIAYLAFTSDLLNKVVARHDTAFIVGNSNFYIVDCTSPTSAQILCTYSGLSLAKGVAVVDSFAFIADGTGGVLALSISHPTTPRFLDRFVNGEIFNTVDVGDSTLFAGSESGKIYSFVYTLPDSLRLIQTQTVGTNVRDVRSHWPYLFVAATSEVAIFRYIR